jgi:hypothetical protein
MEHTNYIGAGELVFSTDKENGINSGGFDVKSIMMKAGISPIMTINNQSGGDNLNKVSDLFDSLVIPNWALSYNNRIVGGRKDIKTDSDEESDEEIDDELHDKLLGLVREHESKMKEKTGGKRTRKSIRKKKNNTKRKK